MKSIREIAAQWKDVREVGNNEGFSNPYYEQLMRKLGWVSGQSWCAYAQMLNWYLYYDGQPEVYAKIKHVLYPHVMTMWDRATQSQIVKTGISPIVGSIACWALKEAGRGHCGLVDAINADGTFNTWEGNTSSGTRFSQANGDGYYYKLRTTKNTQNWRLQGFIYLYNP